MEGKDSKSPRPYVEFKNMNDLMSFTEDRANTEWHEVLHGTSRINVFYDGWYLYLTLWTSRDLVRMAANSFIDLGLPGTPMFDLRFCSGAEYGEDAADWTWYQVWDDWDGCLSMNLRM